MKIYLDLVFFLNFGFDFLLLLGVSYLLRRNRSLKKIGLGAFIGGCSIFLLFIPLSSIQLFFFKIGISLLMILVTFSFKNIRYTMKNLFYLYSFSMILGGALYALNVQFSYQQKGLIFFHNGLSINVWILLICSPIIIYAYLKQGRELKNFYQYCEAVTLYYQGTSYLLQGFIDTGNRLKDPYFGYPIIIISPNILSMKEEMEYIVVPIHTVERESMMKCIRADKLVIHKKEITKFWIGISPNPIQMEGIDCLLQNNIMEEIT